MTSVEDFTGDDAPKRENDEWDMSDVESPLSEAEKSYENRETALKEELFAIVDKRARNLSDVFDDYSDIFHSAEHELSNRFDDSFDNLSDTAKSTSHETLEALFEYVNQKFPAPTSSTEIVPDQDASEKKRLIEAEDNFLRTAMREGNALGEDTEELSKLFRTDGSQNDLYIADSIGHVANESSDYCTSLARAIVEYTNEPVEKNHNRLTRVQSEHERILSNGLFNIASTFDKSRTEIGKKLFDPTVVLATEMTRNSDEYFDGVMDYLRFKMENLS